MIIPEEESFAHSTNASSPRFELKVTGLSCPKCGSPVMDGEVLCSYCSTGLLYELVSDGEKVRFKLPPNAEELPRSMFVSESKEGLAAEMLALVKDTNRVVYVMVNKVPFVVTATTSPSEVVETHKKLRLHIERAELGAFWTEALFKYKTLVEKIIALPTEQKREIARAIEKRHDAFWHYMDDVEKFLARPDLTLALSLTDLLPVNSELEKLEAFVQRFSEYIAEFVQQTPKAEKLELKAPIKPQFNYLTGEKLGDGKKVSTSLGGVAHYSSLSGEPFHSLSIGVKRKAYRGLVSGIGEEQVVMFVMPEEAEAIQAVDPQWTVYTGDVP